MSDHCKISEGNINEDYSTFIKRRRLILLKVLLLIFIIVAAIFIPLNISLGIWTLVYVEIGMIFFALSMFYALRNKENLDKCSLLFVLVGSAWSIIAALMPAKDYTTFVWNAYVPAFTFFLLGKRRGFILTSVYLPTIIGVFIFRNYFYESQQSFVVKLNIITYIVFISLLYMYYESTRAHTEAFLIDDIEKRKKTEAEKVELIKSLEDALCEVKNLSGLLPVCSNCKKIRDDGGYWNKLEVFIEERSEAQFSHGICPECASELYPEAGVDFEAIYKDEFPAWNEEDQLKINTEQESL